MSILNFNFESQYLNSNHEISIILPDKKREISPVDFYGSGRKYKVLWLLHGTFGDHRDWLHKTNIELYAAEKDLAVIMPSALNSNYSNWSSCMMGFNMYDYFTEELMPLIYGWFPISDKREDNFIAGLSMGGRGTIKFAVNYPEKFAAAAVLSAVPVEFKGFREGHEDFTLNLSNPRVKTTIDNAGGLEAYIHSEENVWAMIDQLAGTATLPHLMFACGEEDTLLYKNYLTFKKHCEEIGQVAKWFSLPGYKHEWRFWDKAIQEALLFFGLENTDGGNPF